MFPGKFWPQTRLLDSVYLQPYLRSPRSKENMTGGFSFEKVTRPFLLYNAIIHPFTNLSIKGFTWYQGESNRMERKSYTKLTQTMIQSWRRNFGQGNLPFYYVQVAPFWYDQADSTLADYAFFREAQENISVYSGDETERGVTMLRYMQTETEAWQNARNNKNAMIDWQFKNEKARIKLKTLPVN